MMKAADALITNRDAFSTQETDPALRSDRKAGVVKSKGTLAQ
jgi:hypothetical protein